MRELTVVVLLMLTTTLMTGARQTAGLAGPCLGQRPPGRTPMRFAPEIMTAPQGYHAPIAFSPDMHEAVWRPMDREPGPLFFSRLGRDGWSAPEAVRLAPGFDALDPFFAPDGRRLFFLSFQPDTPGGQERERMWFVERTARGWAAPRLVAGLERHPTHWTFSATSRGDLYFTSETGFAPGKRGVVVARHQGGWHYGVPEPLGPAINATGTEQCPFVSPDERYMVFVRGASSSPTRTDLYVSFRNAAGAWTPGIDLGPAVNSPAHDLAPYVTPDGKYLFFTSQRERMNAMHWVDASVIEELSGKATPGR